MKICISLPCIFTIKKPHSTRGKTLFYNCVLVYHVGEVANHFRIRITLSMKIRTPGYV